MRKLLGIIMIFIFISACCLLASCTPELTLEFDDVNIEKIIINNNAATLPLYEEYKLFYYYFAEHEWRSFRTNESYDNFVPTAYIFVSQTVTVLNQKNIDESDKLCAEETTSWLFKIDLASGTEILSPATSNSLYDDMFIADIPKYHLQNLCDLFNYSEANKNSVEFSAQYLPTNWVEETQGKYSIATSPKELLNYYNKNRTIYDLDNNCNNVNFADFILNYNNNFLNKISYIIGVGGLQRQHNT